MRNDRERRALFLGLAVTGIVNLVGCANVASRTPAEVVARVGSGNDLRITWRGPESDDQLFGFPVIERELEPIYEKCRQQQGAAIPLRQSVRFAGPSLMRDQRPEFVHSVTTEIRCKQSDQVLWVARINYMDHRFYQDIQNRDRIQLILRTKFVAGEAVALDEEVRRRQAEAKAVAEKRYADEAAQRERERLAEIEVKQAEERAKGERLRAELPVFRARLKPGDRVGILHSPRIQSVSAVGLVIEVKPGLAQVQFRETPNVLNPNPKTELLWFQLEQLVPPQ